MPNEQEWTNAQKEIMKRTESGAVTWSANRFSPSSRKNVVGDVVYSADINGRILIMYEYTYTAYDEDGPMERRDVAIEFVDENGNLQWPWPKLPYRRQLLDAVQYRLSGAQDFLKGFLPHTMSEPQSVQNS